MKRIYEKPAFRVIDLLPENMIASSINIKQEEISGTDVNYSNKFDQSGFGAPLWSDEYNKQ